jgi:hypothetical protein
MPLSSSTVPGAEGAGGRSLRPRPERGHVMYRVSRAPQTVSVMALVTR